MDAQLQASDLPPAHKLAADVLFIIFSLLAGDDRPSMCSCIKHGPDSQYGATKCTYTLGWVKVSHVCQPWRDVLLEMRSLWANDVCALNNSAMVEFVRRAGDRPLSIDLTSNLTESMSSLAIKLTREALIRDNMLRAREIRSSRNGELVMLAEQSFPVLEVLELLSHRDMTIGAPNLRDVTVSGNGRITFVAPKLLRAKCLSPGAFPSQMSSLRILEFKWPSDRCTEIPLILWSLSRLTKLDIEVYDEIRFGNILQEDIDTEFAVHGDIDDILGLRSQGVSLSLPDLCELRVCGKGAARRTMCGLLAHLITTSSESLRRIEVHCDDPKLTHSSLTLDAIRTFTHAIQTDAVYIHFRDVIGGVSVVLSASRLEFRHDPKCPSGTFGFSIPNTANIDAIVGSRLIPLLPLRHITHLFVDSLPFHGPAKVPARVALDAALSQFTSVHTLHVSDNDRFSSSTAMVSSNSLYYYPLVGPVLDPNLPALRTLCISYSSGAFRDWWKRLSLALAARKSVRIPFTSLRITHRWSTNVRRPEGATLSLLETFHAQSGVDLQAPDVFVANAPTQAFDVDGTSGWAKEKVESAARSLFAQVVERIEIEEASWSKPIWPPNL